MLLAEIHGKACPEVEGLEDLITSAVFGHLRLVQPPQFWPELFRRAKTAAARGQALYDVLQKEGIDPELYTRLEIRFWRSFSDSSEPDLLLRFNGNLIPPLILLIEVKLNSGKSGCGERDQLARYLRLLDDPSSLPEWPCDASNRFLVYLTRSFAADDLKESVNCAKSFKAQERMFGLEWNDILEIADKDRSENYLLGEVADFLKRRDLKKFNGFHPLGLEEVPSGSFYATCYFTDIDLPDFTESGRFYER